MNDVEFMKNPELWPIWPRLPLKKRRGNLGFELAIMIEGTVSGRGIGTVKPIVYFATMYEVLDSDTPRKQYDSFEAIVEDGWVVD
jgi:hypothetical protein